MSDSQWKQQGATLSHKNACKEFGLAVEDIMAAMKAGKLQYRENFAHGNPYFRLLRQEVHALALELRGASGVEDQESKHKLELVEKEIRKLRDGLHLLRKRRRSWRVLQRPDEGSWKASSGSGPLTPNRSKPNNKARIAGSGLSLLMSLSRFGVA